MPLAERGIWNFVETLFPLSENQLCKFVAHFLKHTSIKGYLSAVRRMQIVGGMGTSIRYGE